LVNQLADAGGDGVGRERPGVGTRPEDELLGAGGQHVRELLRRQPALALRWHVNREALAVGSAPRLDAEDAVQDLRA
jgi:hypothetical protein